VCDIKDSDHFFLTRISCNMLVPRSCTTSFELRSFSSSGPTAWNDMPAHLRNLDLSLSGLLKTALFQTVPV